MGACLSELYHKLSDLHWGKTCEEVLTIPKPATLYPPQPHQTYHNQPNQLQQHHTNQPCHYLHTLHQHATIATEATKHSI